MTNFELIRAMRVDQQRRGLSPVTVKVRNTCLRCLDRWLDGRAFGEATREDIERFLDERHLSASSRYSWIAQVHTFYAWAVDEGYLTDDPTAKITRPKLRRALPRPASSDELSMALSKADPEFRCWVLLGAYQGLRVQEIAGLARHDVIEAEGILRVAHAKGGKERMLPLHPAVRDALERLPMPRAGWVFLRPAGGRYTREQLGVVFNRKLRDYGVDATAHQLRHWFATNLYVATRDLLLTQEMMGHSSPTTTAIYTAFDRRAAAVAVTALSLEEAG